MSRITWILGAVLLLGLGAFLHYTLPQRDVVRILGTEIKREAHQIENAQGEVVTRPEDVRYIQTVDTEGNPHVYRNQDTGWGWPPYFKFDSANLATRADNATSTEENPKWYVVTHYGWRMTLFSLFPNAVGLERAEGPDQSITPWFNIAVVALVIAALLALRHRLLRLFERLGPGRREGEAEES